VSAYSYSSFYVVCADTEVVDSDTSSDDEFAYDTSSTISGMCVSECVSV
jgi:hypothetical protein